MSSKKHIHRFRPIWLLLTAPADLQGWQKIVTYAECIICHQRATIAGEQHPLAVQSRLVEEDA